jgi:hypothetical protein
MRYHMLLRETHAGSFEFHSGVSTSKEDAKELHVLCLPWEMTASPLLYLI